MADIPTAVMTDVMTEVPLMAGRVVKAELVQMIEEPIMVEGQRVVREEVGVVTLEVVGVVEEMEEEVVAEVKKAKVGVEGENQVATEENPPE